MRAALTGGPLLGLLSCSGGMHEVCVPRHLSWESMQLST